MVGRPISHYQILEKVGEGRSDAVHKASDNHLDRCVSHNEAQQFQQLRGCFDLPQVRSRIARDRETFRASSQTSITELPGDGGRRSEPTALTDDLVPVEKGTRTRIRLITFGLDQVNLRVPRSLIGRGEVDVVLTVDGKIANTLRVNIK